ncbi:MAG: competence/damage-inducible protein A [Polyangiaceae bacterium]|nr:competence/damage-inducible protein A [Polyangiaceae bacterium]
MTIALLSIGTELTRGELTNTNAVWLAERLSSFGLEVTAIETVDDHPDRILRSLKRLAKEHTAIVCTGGLGPTTDDITTECVARALGVNLELHEPSLVAIRERLARFGRSLTPSNEKQAYFPAGASVLPNSEGTAPGFSVELSGCHASFLPGVPLEMRPMYERYVEPRLLSNVANPLHQVVLRTFGMAEAAVNDALRGIESEFGVVLGYRAHFPEIEVKVLAQAATLELAQQKAEAVAEVVAARLGEAVYGKGRESLPQQVARLLAERGLTFAAAESCTGGLVSELLTAESGASNFFVGAVVCYANSAKEQLLNVPPRLLEAHGAVSEEVAKSMAAGAKKSFGAHLALAITGIAGPTGGSAEKPLGLVHVALATPNDVSAFHYVRPGERTQNRIFAAYSALNHLRKWLVATAT